ncbi:MAG: SoxR reducing system RseC family protein [Nitrospinae bacterium]|nr:SoxR reducing system RseC family protein [Nitrospinota bacterium]
MEEEGIVIDTSGEFAKVEAKRSSGCEGCTSKDICKPGGNSSMIIEVLNPVHAQAGDRVQFEIGSGVLMKSAFIVYLIPIIFLLTGAWIGGELENTYFQLKDREIVSVLCATIFFIGGVLFLVILNRYFQKNKKYKPVIKEIL